MREFLIRVSLFVFPALLLVVLVNCFIDPAHLYYRYHTDEDRVVSLLVESKSNVTNIDDDVEWRYLKKQLALNYDDSVQTIVLGSSRTNYISSSKLGEKILNLGVPGCILEDEMALFYAATQNKSLKPGKVILEFAPQMFNDNTGDFRWQEIQADFDSCNALLGYDSDFRHGETDRLEREKRINLFTLSYFQQSFKLLKSKNMGDGIEVTDNIDDTALTLCYDGSRGYRKELRKLQTDIDEGAKHMKYHQWEGFDELSEQRIDRFVGFVRFAKSLDLEVVLYFSPYHPNTYLMLTTHPEYKNMVEAMRVVQKIAKEEGVGTIGSFNPQECGCDESCFDDGMHPNAKGTGIIFRNYSEIRTSR